MMYEMLAGYPPFYDDNPMGIYKKIVEGYYELPVVIKPTARELIQLFLRADCQTRLGCTKVSCGSINDVKGGITEVKAHRWFQGVDWQAVLSRRIPSPWRPNVKNEVDTHYFDKYPEVEEKSLSICDEEELLFADF